MRSYGSAGKRSLLLLNGTDSVLEEKRLSKYDVVLGGVAGGRKDMDVAKSDK